MFPFQSIHYAIILSCYSLFRLGDAGTKVFLGQFREYAGPALCFDTYIVKCEIWDV